MRRATPAWETFSRAEAAAGPPPDAPPRPAPAGPVDLDALLARARGEGRADGFAAGAAEAEARGDAALRVLLTDLRERLDDLRVAAAEREARLSQAVLEVAEALLDGVAPAFARAGLAAEVAAAAAEALAAAPAGAPRPAVRVSPAQAERVRQALAVAGLALEVGADPGLDDLHARIDGLDGADRIDLDAAIDAARAALDRRRHAARRQDAHG